MLGGLVWQFGGWRLLDRRTELKVAEVEVGPRLVGRSDGQVRCSNREELERPNQGLADRFAVNQQGIVAKRSTFDQIVVDRYRNMSRGDQPVVEYDIAFVTAADDRFSGGEQNFGADV